MKLQEALDEEAILEEQMLALMHRFADRFMDRRVEINNLMVLHDHYLSITIDADLLEFLQQLADNDGSSLIPPDVLRVLNSKACRGSGYIGSSFSIRFETKHDGCGLARVETVSNEVQDNDEWYIGDVHGVMCVRFVTSSERIHLICVFDMAESF
uniref:MutL protein homolog 3 n=1 Tax=Tanacetum cinerariifolium TaxID=118510 RepID=A0A6L2KJI4_TANCI|nr:MutL protein homolog 3 [Tanacetum cinerariifolium]